MFYSQVKKKEIGVNSISRSLSSRGLILRHCNSFDNVLVRDDSSLCWVAQLFSHIIECKKNYPYLCTNGSNRYCIPYNDDTKYLVGTKEEAPEYYRYWED